MPTIAALAALLVLWFAPPTAAQEVQRIAALVNDEVISGYDLELRVTLVIRTTQLPDTPDTRRRLRRDVLRALVDEKLRLQEAERNDIRVEEGELRRALLSIARQNNVPDERLDDFLRANGVPKAALEQQIKAELAWSKLLRRRMRASVTVSEEEIDEAMARIQENADQVEAQVSEIFLPVDSPELEAETLRAAEGIARQIRDGAPFEAVARQFSRGTTAAAGGAIGWIRSGQLAPELEQAVAALQPGQVSDPVRAVGGFYILQLNDRRRLAGDSDVELRLKRIQLPPDADMGEAARVAQETQGCEAAADAAQRLGSEAADVGPLSLNELPPRLRDRLAELPIGRFAEPLADDAGVMLLMVCGREAKDASLPTREQIAEDLLRQRMGTLAQRYMRDLRRSAVVELR